MARKIIIFIFGIALFVAGLILLVLQLTSGLVKSADAFFAQIATGNTQAAYESTTKSLQLITTYEGFENLVVQQRLDTYASSSWSSRSIENGFGTLNGTVTLSDGTTYQTDLEFQKEEGVWKVNYLYFY